MRKSSQVLLEIAEWQAKRSFTRTAALASPHVEGYKVHLWSTQADPSVKTNIVVVIEDGRQFVSWSIRRDRFSRLLRIYNRKLKSYRPMKAKTAA